jgi:hypothetical protein
VAFELLILPVVFALIGLQPGENPNQLIKCLSWFSEKAKTKQLIVLNANTPRSRALHHSRIINFDRQETLSFFQWDLHGF